MTGLPLIVAEEMDADWSKVAIDWAPADKEVYGYTFTNSQRMMAIVGSRATQLYYGDLRIAGAQVRKVLLLNAAQRWNVDPGSLRTEPSVVVDPASGRRLSYGEIAEFARIPEPLPSVTQAELKAKKDFRLIGKPVPRRDIPAKVTGGPAYVQDIRLPGMLHGRVVRPPRYGARLDNVDDAAARATPGVIAVVRDGSFLGVVAEREEQAVKA